MFVEPAPPAHAQMPYFDCTSSRLAPTTDLTLAAVMGLAVIGASSESQQNTDDTAFLVTTVLITGALVASGIRGLQQTSDCRDAKSELAGRLILRPNANANRRATPHLDPWQAEGPPPATVTPDQAPAPESAPAGTPPPTKPPEVQP